MLLVPQSLTRGRHDLPHGNSPIIGRYLPMPVGTEILAPQAVHRALGQILVLKTSSGEHHALFAYPASDHDHGLHEGVMKFCRDSASLYFAAHIVEHPSDQRRPIYNEGGMQGVG